MYVSHERRAQIEHAGRLHGAPELIVEILSPGNENRRRDEVIKRQTYGKFGVDEYWIVDPEQRTIVVYRLQEGVLRLENTYAAQDQLTTPLSPISCFLSVAFSPLNRCFPLCLRINYLLSVEPAVVPGQSHLMAAAR